MYSQLKRFRIEGLHNVHTIDIPIADNQLVLVGENGTGKSTVANFIYFFLTTQWHRMLNYTFKSIFAVIDGREYELSHKEIKDLVSRGRFLQRAHRVPRTLMRELEMFLENAASQSEREYLLQQFATRYDIPSRVFESILTNWADPSDPEREDLKQLRKSMTDQVLYLPTYRRIEQDLETIFPDLARDRLRDARQTAQDTNKENRLH